jgi:hypothetical protein
VQGLPDAFSEEQIDWMDSSRYIEPTPEILFESSATVGGASLFDSVAFVNGSQRTSVLYLDRSSAVNFAADCIEHTVEIAEQKISPDLLPLLRDCIVEIRTQHVSNSFYPEKVRTSENIYRMRRQSFWSSSLDQALADACAEITGRASFNQGSWYLQAASVYDKMWNQGAILTGSGSWYDDRLCTYIRLLASDTWVDDLSNERRPLEGDPAILAMAYLIRRLTRELLEEVGAMKRNDYGVFANTARLQGDAMSQLGEKEDDAMFFFSQASRSTSSMTDFQALRTAIECCWMRDARRLASDWRRSKVKPIPKRGYR